MIASPKDTWPNVKHLGISMRLSDRPGLGGGSYFDLGFDADYAKVQEQFHACVATHDPQNVADLSHLHPYHVDTLLQMSDYQSQMGEHATAADLIERAVYALELGMNQSFLSALQGGVARVDYHYQGNRAMYHVLFRHMLSVGRRGCNRTALELSRLILSLSFDCDPMGVMCCLDYYALRCRQFTLVTKFYDFFSNLPSAHQMYHAGGLPSLHFSYSLALWHLSNASQSQPASSASSTTPSPPPPLDALVSALANFPSALRKLLIKCNVTIEGGDWAALLDRPYFMHQASGGVEHLIDIFVERQHTLWKPTQVMAFLSRATKILCQRLDAGEAMTLRSVKDVSERAGREYTHLVVSNFSDAVTVIPADVMREAQGFGGVGVPMRDARAGGVGDDDVNRLDANANPLLLFLASMLPWNAAPADDGNMEAGVDPDAALARQLQQQMLAEDD